MLIDAATALKKAEGGVEVNVKVVREVDADCGG